MESLVRSEKWCLTQKQHLDELFGGLDKMELVQSEYKDVLLPLLYISSLIYQRNLLPEKKMPPGIKEIV